MATWKWRESFVLNAFQLVSTNGFSGRVITEMASCVRGKEECVPEQAVTESVTLNLGELRGSPGCGELNRYLVEIVYNVFGIQSTSSGVDLGAISMFSSTDRSTAAGLAITSGLMSQIYLFQTLILLKRSIRID